MFEPKEAFSGFSVDNLEKAEKFYAETLGVKVDKEEMGLSLHLPGTDTVVFVYDKPNHEPAPFTILNFVVEDIDTAIDELTKRGITFERYDDMPAEQDEKGVLRGLSHNMGPDIAWFKDPAGNVLALLQKS